MFVPLRCLDTLGRFHCIIQGISVLSQASPLQDVCALSQRKQVLVSDQVRLAVYFLLARSWKAPGANCTSGSSQMRQTLVCLLVWYLQKH